MNCEVYWQKANVLTGVGLKLTHDPEGQHVENLNHRVRETTNWCNVALKGTGLPVTLPCIMLAKAGHKREAEQECQVV